MQHAYTHFAPRYIRGVILWILSCIIMSAAYAAPAVSEKNLDQSLTAAKHRLVIAQERAALAKLKLKTTQNELEQMRATQLDLAMSTKQLEHVNLQYALTNADLDSIRINLIESGQLVDSIQARLALVKEKIKSTMINGPEGKSKKAEFKTLNLQQTQLEALLEIELSRAKVLNTAKDLISERRRVEGDWKNELKLANKKYEAALEAEKLRAQEDALQAEQSQWLSVLTDLNQKVHQLEKAERTDQNIAELNKIHLKLIEAEEKSNLNQLKLVALSLNERINNFVMTDETQAVAVLNQAISGVNSMIADIENIQSYIGRKLKLLELRRKISEEKAQRGEFSATTLKEYTVLLDNLTEAYMVQQKNVNTIVNRARQQLTGLQEALRKALSRRQSLPALDLNAWQNIGENMLRIPDLSWKTLTSIKEQVIRSLVTITTKYLSMLVLAIFGWCGIWWGGKKLFAKVIASLSEKSKTVKSDSLLILIEILRRHWGAFAIFGGVATVLLMLSVSLTSLSLLFYLILASFALSIVLSFARLTLLETVVHISGHDVNLYKGLRWVALIGYVLGVITILVHYLPVDYSLSDFFNRLAMFYLLIVSLFLLYKRTVVPTLLAPYIEDTRPYLNRLVSILSVLIPLALLSNAMIGLIGYVGLAWRISQYQLIFILVLTGYILLRGLLIDAMRLFASYLVTNVRNGWLWSEAFLKPLDRLLRLALLVFAWYVLFLSYGWDEDSAMGKSIVDFLNLKLFTLGDTEFTPVSILILGFVVTFLYWGARWSRELSYRVLFKRARDAGTRNSLAVFTQYTVVFLGILIGVKALKIDISALKFILGGLAVGLGFGLRDLANNFVSGVLLLIERPVKTGDIVTIGGYEGEVGHIGMRSMTVHTWDHMDVLVPNSETFSKSFMNWTRQDPIVRSVIPIKVHRADNPHHVAALTLNVLKASLHVLNDPPPEVLVREVTDTLVELEARYFIDLQKSNSRIRVRSEILYKLCDTFKEHGVRPPYPHHEIQMV